MTLCLVISVRYTASCQFLFHFSQNTFIADCQHLIVMYANMAYTVVKIITRRKHIVINHFLCLIIHIG